MTVVLDASAVLAGLLVSCSVTPRAISRVATSPMFTLLIATSGQSCFHGRDRRGMVLAHDYELAFRTGHLAEATRRIGLSLGARACLALAQKLGLPAVTADRASLRLGVDIEVIR